MKKYALLLVVAVLAVAIGVDRLAPTGGGPGGSDISGAKTAIADAFREHASNRAVQGQGEVVAVLADDTRGSQHQRFILGLAGGHTLLIAHNIDIARRIPDLQPGDRIRFKGVYEWNPKGGVVHWTHRDPGGRHPGGWLRRADAVYR